MGISLQNMAGRISTRVVRETGLDEGCIDVMRFGLEIILGILIKGIVLFAIAYILRILPEVLVALGTGCLFRLISGGAHCKTYSNCMILGLVLYLGAAELGKFLGPIVTAQMFIILVTLVILPVLGCVVKWAPSGVKQRPIKAGREQVVLRVLSIIYVILWYSAVVFLFKRISMSFLIAGGLGLLIQTITMTPLGYILLGSFDSAVTHLWRKGGDMNATV